MSIFYNSRNHVRINMMGYTDKQLIEQYRKLHSENGTYGKTSLRLRNHFQRYVDQLNPGTVLDYGCGKSKLIDNLETNAQLYRYDPAIPEYSEKPEDTFDLVINTDVLEHIPENLLPGILSNIKHISKNAAFCICLVEAVHTLPDGSNCHLTVRPVKWWIRTLRKYFPEIYKDKIIRNRKVLLTTWRT